jgi:hypothetical protein
MQWQPFLPHLFLDIHHFPYELLSILNFCINVIGSDHFGMLMQMVLVHFKYFSLQFILLFVDESQVVFHELLDVQVVVAGALACLVQIFGTVAGGLVLGLY